MKVFVFFMLLVLAACRASFAQDGPGRQPQEKPAGKVLDDADLASPLPQLKLEGTLPELLEPVVRRSGGSGGMATTVSTCSQGARSSLSIAAGTPLNHALDRIAETQAAKWDINEGVINMFPASGIPALLETRIHNFEWDKTAPSFEVVGQLENMPEVIEQAKRMGLKKRGVSDLSWGTGICIIQPCPAKPMPVIELEREATVISILNRIAAIPPRVGLVVLAKRMRR